jgi:glycine cleavage system H protein
MIEHKFLRIQQRPEDIIEHLLRFRASRKELLELRLLLRRGLAAEATEIQLPDDLYYQPDDHLWVRVEGTRARIGLDDQAQRSAGTVSAVRLKPAGRPIAKGKPFGTMEAGKYVGPLKAPFAGQVIEINSEVMSKPGLLNSDPYGKGWLILIEPENAARDLPGLVHGDGDRLTLRMSLSDDQITSLIRKNTFALKM